MRTATIPMVIILAPKEEPELIAFDEGSSEEQICEQLMEEFDHSLTRVKTVEELNQQLPSTGASQEPGWYWDVDDPCGAPCGPYRTEEEATEAWRKVCRSLK